MPNPDQIAKVTIDGTDYADWESINVHVEFPGEFRTVRLTVSENAAKRTMVITPGDACTVTLGGQSVLTGYVYERQVSMDAHSHGVQVSAMGVPSDTVLSSIDLEDLGNGGQFTGQSLKQIAPAVLSRFKIKPVFKGDPEAFEFKFEHAQVQPGESAFHFFERLSRIAGAYIGDDHQGNYVFYGGVIGKGAQAGAALIEGKNITWIRAIASDLELVSKATAFGQATGSDKAWGKAPTAPKVKQEGNLKRYRPVWFQVERGLDNNSYTKELQMRLDFEMAWREGTKVSCEVGVVGWFAPNGRLWEPGPESFVTVSAPTAKLSEMMMVQQCTFEQTNEGGTVTTLGLIDPRYYGGQEQIKPA